MDAMSESVVVVGGISLMTTVDSSLTLILARTLTAALAVLSNRARPSGRRSGNPAGT